MIKVNSFIYIAKDWRYTDALEFGECVLGELPSALEERLFRMYAQMSEWDDIELPTLKIFNRYFKKALGENYREKLIVGETIRYNLTDLPLIIFCYGIEFDTAVKIIWNELD